MDRGTATNQEVFYFNSKESFSVVDFSRNLYDLILKARKEDSPIIFLCIGTDRATGDCLGPIIGHKLSKKYGKGIFIYGTLDKPVHAKNLDDTIGCIYKNHLNPFIIAIDASLGLLEHVGYITLGEGPLKPGAGVNKDLPAVGDIFITGIVNFSGVLDNMLLQTTRLNIVVTLADFIYSGINYCYQKLDT